MKLPLKLAFLFERLRLALVVWFGVDRNLEKTFHVDLII